MHIEATRAFSKLYRKLPGELKQKVKDTLELLQSNPNHPSLRHKKMTGQRDIFEVSITMNYRITYQKIDTVAYLRKVGTHNILNRP